MEVSKPVKVRGISKIGFNENRNQTLIISGLCLVVFGEANHRFSKGTLQSTTYVVREQYLKEETFYFGSKNGQAVELPVGVRNFQFTFQLPPDLPQSGEGIQYGVKVVLIRPWSIEKTVVRTFEIARLLDLKLHPIFNQPIEVEKKWTRMFDLAGSKSLVMKIRLPRTAFVLGETFLAHVEFINLSSANFVSSFGLKEIKTYRCYSTKKIKKKSIAYFPCEDVNRKSEKAFDVKVNIPKNLQTSNLREVKLALERSFVLYISARTDWETNGPKIKIPIIIGTVGYA